LNHFQSVPINLFKIISFLLDFAVGQRHSEPPNRLFSLACDDWIEFLFCLMEYLLLIDFPRMPEEIQAEYEQSP
jgi:hypothetical protein